MDPHPPLDLLAPPDWYGASVDVFRDLHARDTAEHAAARTQWPAAVRAGEASLGVYKTRAARTLRPVPQTWAEMPEGTHHAVHLRWYGCAPHEGVVFVPTRFAYAIVARLRDMLRAAETEDASGFVNGHAPPLFHFVLALQRWQDALVPIPEAVVAAARAALGPDARLPLYASDCLGRVDAYEPRQHDRHIRTFLRVPWAPEPAWE